MDELWSKLNIDFYFQHVVVLCHQLTRKQKRTEEDQSAPVPSAVCDEASTSVFTDIPISLPYQEQEQEHKKALETPTQQSDQPSEKQRESPSPHTFFTPASTKTLQSILTSPDAALVTDTKDPDGVIAQQAELKVSTQTKELGKEKQPWNQLGDSAQFRIINTPSAPALYPSLQPLEEASVTHLWEEATNIGEKGPAVLSLPEQESSPPSLQPLESVAEFSMNKLYPELPKVAPEIQVVPQTRKYH